MVDQTREQMILEVIEQDPDDPMLFFTLGKLYLDEERFEEAQKALKKAVELDKGYSAAWLELGRAHLGADDEEKARGAFEQSAKHATANGDLRVKNEARDALDQLDEF